MRWWPGLRWMLLALLVLVPCAPLWATTPADPWRQLQRPWFDKVGMADGLPHSITTALAQARSGVLWIGTMGGLARYDGYRMQVYELARHGDNGLPDAYVRCLLALPDGSLLIGTNAGGLARFDPQTNQFHTYPVGTGGTHDRKIYALAADGNRGVWIASEGGLDYLDLRTERIHAVPIGAQASARNFTVYQDRAGDVWLGNEAGLFVRAAGHHDFVRPPQPDGVIHDVLHDQVWAIREDAERRLWVGSVQRGAVYRAPGGQWATIPGLSYPAGSARQATVRDFAEVAPNQTWIATDGDGIVEYTVGDDATRAINHDISLPSSLPGDAVRALLPDRTGNVWAATDQGAAHSDVRPTIAFSLLPSIEAAHALANPNVRSVFVDSHQRVWLGMAAGHIDMIDLAHGVVHHLALGGKQAHRDVQGLAEAPDGSIWVATQGLARIDPATLTVHDGLIPALADTAILSLARQGKAMLIGTYVGAYRYDTRNRQLIRYGHADKQPDSLANDSIHEIAPIGDSLWYATGNGISIAHDPAQTSGFVNIRHRAGDATSLPQNLVISLAQDRRGRVWVGTLGGLGLLPGGDLPPYRVRSFDTADGLISDKINAVLPDLDDHVWMSTSNGIAVIDGDSLRIRNLGVRDGQHIDSYIYAAAARTADGTLLFGGLGGLTVIRPQHAESAALPAPLRITQARVNGQVLPYAQLFVDHGALNLTAHQRNLRVDFSLLDFQPAQETAYSYHMDGFDDGWIDIPKGASPSAVYTNLPHGHYVLRLRALPRGLHTHPIDYTLNITVAPLWYETLWARLLALTLLLAVVALLVHLRTVYLRRRALRLQLQIDLHTHELRVANRRLDHLAGTDELTGLNNRRRLLELIEAIRRDGPAPASVALLDLDHFKRVNDEHGHLAGDAALRATAGILRQHLRHGDLAGRYGGEEMVLCLPGTTLAQAMAITERIRLALRQTRIRHDAQKLAITVSIGVAELRPGESMNSWLSRADAALYQSKHQGRDRCTAAD